MGDGFDGGKLSQGTFLFTPHKHERSVLTSDWGIKLVTTDEKKTVIAEFHRAHHIINKRKARLEVQPAGMRMLDYIVLTFVFVEHKRREREEGLVDATGSFA
jgi:membrane-anchored protein YejM (alkaline phosphatase superfamily)